jgi:hypothetical protein
VNVNNNTYACCAKIAGKEETPKCRKKTVDATNKMAFLGGKEGAALCIALLCTIVVRRRLSSKKRSTMGCISMKSIRSDGTWMEIDQSENRILISINL